MCAGPHPLIQKVAALATEADDAGLQTLCLALMGIVRGAKLPKPVARGVVNTGIMMLDVVESMRPFGGRRTNEERRRQ